MPTGDIMQRLIVLKTEVAKLAVSFLHAAITNCSEIDSPLIISGSIKTKWQLKQFRRCFHESANCKNYLILSISPAQRFAQMYVNRTYVIGL